MYSLHDGAQHRVPIPTTVAKSEPPTAPDPENVSTGFLNNYPTAPDLENVSTGFLNNYPTAPDPENVSTGFPNNYYHFNDSTCVPPSLDKENIGQSLSNFEKYCEIIGVPLFHKRRLLLAELKRCSESLFLNFLNSGDNTYAGLKMFILRRFECVAKIHKVNLNPSWIANDAFSQFSNAVDLYEKTPPHEFIKFLVLRTSPIYLQQSMQPYLNLPYAEFYGKYKSKLAAHNNANSRINPVASKSHQPQTSQQQTLTSSESLCYYHQSFGKDARNCSYMNCPMSHLVGDAIVRYRASVSKPKNDEMRKEN